jgi:hypothetical protein
VFKNTGATHAMLMTRSIASHVQRITRLATVTLLWKALPIVSHVMMIITGILIEKYGLNTGNPELEKMFGWGMISLGPINMVIDYIKKPKKK